MFFRNFHIFSKILLSDSKKLANLPRVFSFIPMRRYREFSPGSRPKSSKKMDFRKITSRLVSQSVSRLAKNRKNFRQSRALQVESLENRELLAVSILDSPVSAYAAQENPAEIQFNLATDSDGSAKIDFNVQSGGGIDPSKLRLVNRATGQEIALSNVVDGKTSSSASAQLVAGSYSVFVGSDAGSGTFTLDILHDDKAITSDSSLLILVEAALAEQQSGWSSRREYYNKLLSNFPGFGSGALNGGRVKELFPQVDVNRDGKVDATDYRLAQQIVAGSIVTPSIQMTPVVINQDRTGPTITASLKNDTGTPGDEITTDTTIVGRITDTSGIRSAQYKLDNGSWASLSLDANGNYTIPNQQVSAGSHTITISATDRVGNTSTTTTTFVYPTAKAPTPSDSGIVEGGSGTVSLGKEFQIQKVAGRTITVGQTLTLDGNKGTVKLNADGSLTFTPGSDFGRLAQGEKETYSVSVVSKDEYGREYTSTVSFQITGKNDLPFIQSGATRPALSVNEGTSGTISSSTILKNWTDIDKGAQLSVVDLGINAVDCSNTALASTFTKAALEKYLSVSASGVKFDASNDFFKQLGINETLTITVSYKVSDGIGTSTDTGFLNFTINGKDNPSVLTAARTTFDLVSNDMKNSVKAVDPGFSVSDPDGKDKTGFVYSIKSVSNSANGLITNFNSSTGTFSVDTSKLADPDAAGRLVVVVSVRSLSGGTVEKSLTINLNPSGKPVAAKATLSTPETVVKTYKINPSGSGNKFSTSNLKLVSGTLPSGVASLDADGNFRFDPGTHFEYLTVGQELNFVFEYTITDEQYGLTGTGTIELKVVGTATPAKAPANGLIGTGGKYKSTETGGTAPRITVSKTDLLAGWNLAENSNVYSVVPAGNGASFYGWSDGNSNPFGSDDFGTITVDANGNLVFTPTEAFYRSLGQGQWVDLIIDYSVQNSGGGQAVSGGSVLFRIEGRNDHPTLTTQRDSFAIPSNPLAELEMDPGFQARDVDWNDSSFSYAVDDTSYEKGFRVDSATGIISISKENVSRLAGNQNVVITLRDSHGGTVSKTIAVDVYRENDPSVEHVRIEVDENASKNAALLDAVEQKDGHRYSIGDIQYKGCSENSFFPAGFDPMELVEFDGNRFVFSADENFDKLSLGETLTLSFEFTVSDLGFSDCTTTRTITVVISGVNDSPVFDSEAARENQLVQATESNPVLWRPFFSDVDRNDILSISAINGRTFVDNVVNIENLGTFRYENGTLSFTPSADFDSLREGVSAVLQNIVLTVEDGRGGNIDGTLFLEIRGTNKAPVLADFESSIGTNGIIVIELAGKVSDRNSGDPASFYRVRIEGKTLDAENTEITLDNGVKISLDFLAGTLTVDSTKRTEYPADGKPETISMKVVVTDHASENMLSNEATWNVVIGTTPPKVEPVEISGISEDDSTAPAPVELKNNIIDTNTPQRKNDDVWYEILGFALESAKIGNRELTAEQYARIADFWNYNEVDGILEFNAPDNGYFDFLAGNETLVLTFTYTVRDKFLKDDAGNELKTDGTISLSLDGVNTDPVISIVGELVDKTTNSGLPSDAKIEIGQFTYTDVDKRNDDVPSWDIRNVRSDDFTVADGLVLVDANGNVSLDNSKLPVLAPGQSVNLSFDVVVEDGVGGEDSRTVSITVYGKKLPIVQVDDLTTTESVGMSTMNPITVTDPEEVFTEKREGDSWYEKPGIVSVSPGTHENKFDSQTLADLFEIIGGPETGYSIRFNGTKEQFAFLHDREELVFDIQIEVVDKLFNVKTTVDLKCTIIGTGDRHSVNISPEDSNLEFWVNETGVREKDFRPEYIVGEIDEVDGQTEGHRFELGDITGNLPAGFNRDEHILVNGETGEITVVYDGFASLTENTSLNFTVNVIGEIDGLIDSVTFTLNVKVAQAPIVEEIDDIVITENENVSRPIRISPGDDAVRGDDPYEITGPVLDAENSSVDTLPPGCVLEIDEEGNFVFDPNGTFDYLGVRDSETLVFQYTVTDKKFGTSTTQTVRITINGLNSSPIVKDELVFGDTAKSDPGIVYGGDAVCLGKIEDMLTDVDRNDVHVPVSIGGVGILQNEWVSVSGKGQFLYDGESLWYKACVAEGETENFLEAIKHGITRDFVFELIVRDDSGKENASGTGSLTIKVEGRNATPVMKTGDEKIKFEVKEDSKKQYTADQLARDRNENDILAFYSINGTVISDENREVRLGDGTTVRILGNDFSILEIDTTTRYSERNLEKGEMFTQALNIVIRDDSGAENDQTGRMSFQLIIEGINDLPTMNDQTFGVGVSSEIKHTEVGKIDIEDPDTPRENYEFSLDGTPVFRPEASSPGLTASGSLHFMIVPGTNEIFAMNIPELASGQYIAYELTVKAVNTNDSGEWTTATITVIFSHKAEPVVDLVGDDIVVGETETERQTIGVDVADPDDSGRDGDWYSYENIRFDSGTISGPAGDQAIVSLPEGAEFGVDRNSNKFYFQLNGAFDYLGRDETATLIFSFVVRDKTYGVDKHVSITVVVHGLNTPPKALDHMASWDYFADDSDDVKFYLSDLVTDRDVNDSHRFASVAGSTDLSGPIQIVDRETGLAWGSVEVKYDDVREEYYLHFIPGSGCESIRHATTRNIVFSFSVTDGVEESNVAEIDFNIRGTNKTPQIKTDPLKTGEKTPLEITAKDVATDANTGDEIFFTGISVRDSQGVLHEIDPRTLEEPVVIELHGGAVLTIRPDGTLLYDPTGRDENLAADEDITLSEFKVKISDDSKTSNAETSGYKYISIEIHGVNDDPVDLYPGENTISGAFGETIRIKLAERFSDADGDSLQFSLDKTVADCPYLKTLKIQDGYLVVEFMPLDEYSNDFDFTSLPLTLDIFDGTVSITKTFEIRLEESLTVALEANVVDGTRAVFEGDRYEVEINVRDRINELFGDDYSLGIYGVSFVIYYDDGLCAIDFDESSGIAQRIGNRSIAVSIDNLTLKNARPDELLNLFRFQVTALGGTGTAQFKIANVSITRDDVNGLIHQSQINLVEVEVEHLGPISTVQNTMVVGYSAPSMSRALSTLPMVFGWTAENELLADRNDQDENYEILDETFGDETLFGDTGFPTEIGTEDDLKADADEWDEILTEMFT